MSAYFAIILYSSLVYLLPKSSSNKSTFSIVFDQPKSFWSVAISQALLREIFSQNLLEKTSYHSFSLVL